MRIVPLRLSRPALWAQGFCSTAMASDEVFVYQKAGIPSSVYEPSGKSAAQPSLTAKSVAIGSAGWPASSPCPPPSRPPERFTGGFETRHSGRTRPRIGSLRPALTQVSSTDWQPRCSALRCPSPGPTLQWGRSPGPSADPRDGTRTLYGATPRECWSPETQSKALGRGGGEMGRVARGGVSPSARFQ
jgi:hypothetical protein